MKQLFLTGVDNWDTCDVLDNIRIDMMKFNKHSFPSILIA